MGGRGRRRQCLGLLVVGGAGPRVLGADEVEILVGVAVGALPGELAAAAALLGVAAHPGAGLALPALLRLLVRVTALLPEIGRAHV